MKRTPITRRSYIKRGGSTLARSGRIARKRRSGKEFARIHGSHDRAEWITSMPCWECGAVGFTVQAHVGKEGKGAGRKANADQIANLCCSRPGVMGCHEKYDERKAPFDDERHRGFVVQRAAKIAEQWDAKSTNGVT